MLVAQHLRKAFGSVVAVDDVSLSVGAGQCVALLGPNGAGKTTTVEILEGLQQADQGTLSIFGMDYRHSGSQIYERIGVVLQETQLYKRATVEETLKMFAGFYQHTRNIETLISDLGLDEKRDVQLRKLSGGQRQRVFLGCALVNEPKMLFLDEPTSGLDPQARRFVWDLLTLLKKRGCAILLTTHFMEEAAELADRIAIMDQGRIVAEGSLRKLLDEHARGTRIDFEHRLGPESLAIAQQALGGHWHEHSGSIQTTTSPAPILTALLELGIEEFTVKSHSLEDVFFNLTGRRLRHD